MKKMALFGSISNNNRSGCGGGNVDYDIEEGLDILSTENVDEILDKEFDDLDILSTDLDALANYWELNHYKTSDNSNHSRKKYKRVKKNSESSSTSSASSSTSSSSETTYSTSPESTSSYLKILLDTQHILFSKENKHNIENESENYSLYEEYHSSKQEAVKMRDHSSKKSRKSRRPRSHPSRKKNRKQKEYVDQETLQRSAFLDFLFEETPSPSKFLTTKAIQNILRCTSCRDILLNNSSSTVQKEANSIPPWDKCLEYLEDKETSKSDKCLLCECTYGETKSLLLEKLTMCWLRPCRYQSYGCQSFVGRIGAASSTIENSCEEEGDDESTFHNEDDCKFQPLHCPFMLCRRKFPMASLIKHLHSEHSLSLHEGPKNEGTIYCLANNKRLRGARPNYALDPCFISSYGHIFILKVLRHSFDYYVWVWALQGEDKLSQGVIINKVNNNGLQVPPRYLRQRSENLQQFQEENKEQLRRGEEEESIGHECFKYTIRFQTGKRQLILKGCTISIRLPMDKIMEQGLCHVIPEQDSLFDCIEESPIIVDYTLVIHPMKISTGRESTYKSQAIGSSRRKSH